MTAARSEGELPEVPGFTIGAAIHVTPTLEANQMGLGVGVYFVSRIWPDGVWLEPSWEQGHAVRFWPYRLMSFWVEPAFRKAAP